jgi:hypothetical protein
MINVFNYIQKHPHSAIDIFPLLCPKRECDWLDGWDYKMIHSESGLIEEGCVFTTSHHGKEETVWKVAIHDTEKFEVSFVRVTPNKNVVQIDIKVEPVTELQSNSHIMYAYVPLNSEEKITAAKMETEFITNMKWWENAINYYLENGKMLRKTE